VFQTPAFAAFSYGSAFEYVLEAFHVLLYGVWVVAQEGYGAAGGFG
jgi:hypothetical protein